MTEVTKEQVVIADDDPGIRQVMRVALERDGFDVIDVGDGAAAVKAFEEHNPAIVLLDVEMPIQDGIQACAQIRVSPQGQNVPIVMVTGREDMSAVNDAYQAGATDFIPKPINWPIFGHRVRYILRASQNYQQLRTSEAKNDALLQAIPDTMMILSNGGQIVDFLPGNSANELPAPKEGVVTIFDYLPRRVAAMWYNVKQSVAKHGRPFTREFSLSDLDGTIKHYEGRFVPYLNDQTLVIINEITERKQAEERIYRLAYFDTLTDLPNRTYFRQNLDKMVAHANETGEKLAVLYVDLDNFKRINDTLGHSFGDGVLQAIAKRLAGCIRRQDQMLDNSDEPYGIARLGGDEFVAVISGVENTKVVSSVADRILEQLRKPVSYQGHEFVVTPSVGVSIYPDNGDNVEDLLKYADIALYQAKGAGRNGVRFYSGTMSLRSMRRLELENGLRAAIDNKDLELHYQPKLNLETGAITGVEALARWKDKNGEYIPPAHFIPIAEESGLIASLGEWVLRAACQQARDWQLRYGTDVEVAVNISSQQFYQSDLRKTIMRALFEASLRPNLLQLELTESILMRDVQATIDTLVYLKDSGISLAIDDFGTGYSSLSYLKRFPLDALKIDRSFVADLEENNDDAAICSAIIAMANRLGLQVIAEGIETDSQLEFLRKQGCAQGQGYLLGRPKPAEDFEKTFLMRKNTKESETAI